MQQCSPYPNSTGIGISDDGTTLFGYGPPPGKKSSQAFVWTEEKPTESVFPWRSFPGDMTPDGTFFTGRALVDGKHWQPYSRRMGQFEFFPISPDHQNADAVATTPSGDKVLGVVFNGDYLGTLSLDKPGEKADARPVMWTKAGLQFLPGFDPETDWWPWEMSDDGNVIVGMCRTRDPDSETPRMGRTTAFRWEDGRVTLLEKLGDQRHSVARAVSGDGRIVVGGCLLRREDNSLTTAFIWDAKHGMRDLGEVLAQEGANPEGWHLTWARAISQDGQTIVGDGLNPQGKKEAWRAYLPRKQPSHRNLKHVNRMRRRQPCNPPRDRNPKPAGETTPGSTSHRPASTLQARFVRPDGVWRSSYSPRLGQGNRRA